MSGTETFRYTHSVLLAPFLAVLAIWAIFWAEIRFGLNLNHFGVYPRTLKGLGGIICSPFIHDSLEHLYNNTIPVAILLAALFYFYRTVSMKVLLLGLVLTGGITWIIARPSYHIGASGIIYLLASFIFFKGVFTKHYRLVALSLGVVFIYGSLLWYIFPVEDGISWEGHLGGFISGLILAFLIRAEVPELRKYAWEKSDFREEDDPFLRHFDKDGNFIEQPDAEYIEGKYFRKPEISSRRSEEDKQQGREEIG